MCSVHYLYKVFVERQCLVALFSLNRKNKLQIYLCLVCISTSLPVSPHSGIFDQHVIYVNYNRQESVKFDLLAR